MLRDLHLKNLAVVDEASIELGEGFHVLSGETGAGKSIVVDSLALLAGVRADAELIRTGAELLSVTGRFEPGEGSWRELLAAAGVEDAGGEVLVRREVARNGRNRVFVNDQPVTLRLLADLAPSLLRIHGQREELGLVDPDLQRAWLDRSGGAEAERLLARVAETAAALVALEARLRRLQGDDRLRRERLDLLRFQLSELDGAGLRPGEEDELRRERDVLRHAEAIRAALGRACELLYDRDEGAVVDALTGAVHALAEVERWEPGAAGWGRELEAARIQVGEVERAVRHRLDQVDADPARLDAIEERLAALERLFRKYGGSSLAALERRAAVAAELAELEGDMGSQDEIEAAVDRAAAAYREAGLALEAGRRSWGEALASGVRAELAELALGGARFSVALERRRRETSPAAVDGVALDVAPNGFNDVVYLFSPNPGEEPRPLAKVASGGELSRLYLAIQLAVPAASGAASPTLVFDEVDSGVGGAEAALLGAKLRRLAQGGQVLAVTHLPQVASQADHHFRVSKAVKAGRTHTAVEPLGGEGRVEEVARMLAGSEVTALSLSHARELIAGKAGVADSGPPSPRRGDRGSRSPEAALPPSGPLSPRRGDRGSRSPEAALPPSGPLSPRRGERAGVRGDSKGKPGSPKERA